MSIDSNSAGSITFTIAAVDAASASMRKVQDGLDGVAASARKATTDAGGVGGGFVQAAASADKFSNSLGSVITRSAEFAAGIAEFEAVHAIFDALNDSAIGFNAHLEQSQVAWTTFLHSSSAATAMIQQLESFAAATPFRFQGLEDSARLLTAMGVSSEKVLPLLTDIGNAVSATGRGAEGMQRVAYVMGEIQSLGQVDDRTLRQLTIDGGIPAFELLAQAMGKSTGEIRKMASEGKITSDQFMEIFHNFVTNNWGDMMVKQSQTFNGALSTIQDNIQITLATAFEPLFERVRDGTVAMANFSQSSNFQTWAKDTASGLDSVLTRLDQLGERAQRDIDILGRAAGAANTGGKLGGTAGGGLVIPSAVTAGAQAGAISGIESLIPGLNLIISGANASDDAINRLGASLGIQAPQAKLFADKEDELGRMGAAAAKSTADLAQYTNYLGTAMGDAYAPTVNMTEALAQYNEGVKNAAAVAAAHASDLATNAANNLNPFGQVNAASQAAMAGTTAQADALAEAATKAGKSFGTLASSEYSAIAGLQAFDNATFGISQRLAGVELAIEQKRLSRLERRTPHSLGQEANLLQEELKVRGLERQVEFGGSLQGFQTYGKNYGATVNMQINVNDASMVGAVVQGHITKLVNGSSNPRSASPRLPGAQ